MAVGRKKKMFFQFELYPKLVGSNPESPGIYILSIPYYKS